MPTKGMWRDRKLKVVAGQWGETELSILGYKEYHACTLGGRLYLAARSCPVPSTKPHHPDFQAASSSHT